MKRLILMPLAVGVVVAFWCVLLNWAAGRPAMFDSHDLAMAVGAVCGSLLTNLLTPGEG